MIKYIKYFLVVIIVIHSYCNSWASIPSWSVNPASYSNSMTFTAIIKLDNVESQNTNDKVGAFVNGECRGVASPIYLASEGHYYVYLLVYSNEAAEENVTFTMYKAETDQQIDLTNKRSFSIDEIIGSVANPYVFLTTNPEKDFQSFEFLGIDSEVSIDAAGKSIIINVANSTDLTNLVAVYQLSDGATAKVNSVTQESGVSSNNFSTDKIYQITGADGAIQNWIVHVSKVNVLGVFSANSNYDKIKIYPIPSSEYISVDMSELNLSGFSMRIFNFNGEEVTLETNLSSDSKINISQYPDGPYVITINVNDKKYTKVFMKQ